MKHTSENQGPLSPEEIEAMQKRARRARYYDMILVLEHNGFRVTAVQKAMDNENQQMIVILRARGFKVIAPNEEIAKLEGIENEQKEEEQEKKDPAPAAEEKGPEEAGAKTDA